jgi:protein TonB
VKIQLGAFALAVVIAPITFAVAQTGAELKPVVSVPPQYPPRMLQRGESGDVTLRFTIDVDGRTKDIEVVEASRAPFERPAVEALRQWRYAPLVENGVPVERHGVETVIRFALGR